MKQTLKNKEDEMTKFDDFMSSICQNHSSKDQNELNTKIELGNYSL